MLLEYPEPDEADTSNPVGAVTVISVVNAVPAAVKLCAAEAVPAHVVKAVRVPVEVMVGIGLEK